MENDVSLLKECKAGSITAFEEIVKTYREQIYNLIYQIIENSDDANDISQEVFIRAYRSIKTFRGEASLSTWLKKIAINLSINHIRQESKYNQKNQEIMDSNDYKSFLGTVRTPLDIIEIKELEHRVNESIRSLSQDERVTFVLRVNNGLSYQEIADMLNCTKVTVTSRLNRARRKMRDKLKDYII